MPLISIITITYNAGRFLERTVQSVLASANDEVEYIIIDGGSTDGTLKIIQNYASRISQWVSEPDKGLYDAMNKGLRRATGEYVWFMNAGDEVYDEQTILQVVAAIRHSHADVYYSDALFVSDDGSPQSGPPIGLRSQVTPHTLPHHLTWHDMALGMKVCHQAFVVRKAIAPTYPTDNLSADLDWEIRSLKAARRVEFLPFVLCRYLTGGVSVQQHRRSLTDRFRVLVQHFGLFPTLVNHVRIIGRAWQFGRKTKL